MIKIDDSYEFVKNIDFEVKSHTISMFHVKR